MFQAVTMEYQSNPLKYVTENLSDSYILISGGGYIASKAQVVSLFKNVKSIEVSFKNLKVKQAGITIIATGYEHNVRHFSDSTPDLAIDYLSTYIYEIKGNKLVGISGQHTYPVIVDMKIEEETIKNMLRQETIDAYAVKDIGPYFIQNKDTFRGWNTRLGYETDMNWEAIKKKNETAFNTRPREMKPENENFTFKFLGNNAVLVTYDQFLYGKSQAPSKEIRMIEKENGNWKISALIALWDFSGNAFETGNVRKTIEAETNAYHAGDVEAMNKQWAYNTSYAERQQEYLKKIGAPAYMKGDNLRAFGEQFKKVHKPTGQTFKISDYEAHVGTTNAWVTYTQEVLEADGKLFQKTREMRILERLDGWKIVAMSNVEL